VITNALFKNNNNNRKIVTIEIDQQLADIARKRLPENVDVIIGNAIKLKSFFSENQVDCIVCSLPWTLFFVRGFRLPVIRGPCGFKG
jgi:phospholipid N-methyltransferase